MVECERARHLSPMFLLGTSFLHLAGFFILCRGNNDFFQVHSLEFDFLSRIVCAKRTWKSSPTATKEIPKGELSFLTRNRKRLFVSKA